MLMTLVAGHLASTLFSALAAFQAEDSINSGNSKLLLVFVAVAAIALAAQAVVIVGIGLVLYKGQKAVMGHIDEIKGKAYPLIEKSQALLTDLRPKINEITDKVNVITGHVEHIAGIAKEKADEFSPTISAANQTVVNANETVAEANRKTRAQIGRIDAMVSSALDATVRLGIAVEKGITAPGREIAGMVSGMKQGLDTLLHGARGFAAGKGSGRTVPSQQPTHAAYRAAAAVVQPRTDDPGLNF